MTVERRFADGSLGLQSCNELVEITGKRKRRLSIAIVLVHPPACGLHSAGHSLRKLRD
jgi:hypothetical protein